MDQINQEPDRSRDQGVECHHCPLLILSGIRKKRFKENPCLQEKCSTVLALPLMFDEVVCIEDKRQFTPDAILGNFMTLRVRETG